MMAFSWIHKQGVTSDEGFSVAFTGRYTLKYTEGAKEMVLEGEDMFAHLEGHEFGFSFYPGWREAVWERPYDKESISKEDRLRIRSNITNALAFMNGKARFE